jgi:hypothetical protein
MKEEVSVVPTPRISLSESLTITKRKGILQQELLRCLLSRIRHRNYATKHSSIPPDDPIMRCSLESDVGRSIPTGAKAFLSRLLFASEFRAGEG